MCTCMYYMTYTQKSDRSLRLLYTSCRRDDAGRIEGALTCVASGIGAPCIVGRQTLPTPYE